MKWYECITDCGDGSTNVMRFKTKEGAHRAMQEYSDFEEFGCYPYGELEEVDTDSKYFWSGE